jgi:hypothetical protein
LKWQSLVSPRLLLSMGSHANQSILVRTAEEGAEALVHYEVAKVYAEVVLLPESRPGVS